MSGFLESITSVLLNKALDVSWQQHSHISNNIANANNDNYQIQSLDFNKVMSEFSGLDGKLKSGISVNDITSLDPTDFVEIEEQGLKVMLDSEIVKLADNTTRYQALIAAKKQFGAIKKLAITGGKG